MIPILRLETLNHIGDSHLAVRTKPLPENTLEREKWKGHKIRSAKRAKLKCVSLFCICFLGCFFFPAFAFKDANSVC